MIAQDQLADLSQYPHVLHYVDFDPSDGYGKPCSPVDNIYSANLISSEIADGEYAGQHTVAIDLDVPARLVPSSTPGHSHLYIDVPMTWDRYVAVLDALADAGVVQHGYVKASEIRKFTTLRLPWIRKEAA